MLDVLARLIQLRFAKLKPAARVATVFTFAAFLRARFGGTTSSSRREEAGVEPEHEGLGTRRGAQMAENDAHFINRGHFGAGVGVGVGVGGWDAQWSGLAVGRTGA